MSIEGEQVVFGANGGIGGALVRELASQGKPVRAVTRSGSVDTLAGVEAVVADALDREAARRACQGASVINHAVNAPVRAPIYSR
jgi:uncharacterized protein YbjT (DUF2867 family)